MKLVIGFIMALYSATTLLAMAVACYINPWPNGLRVDLMAWWIPIATFTLIVGVSMVARNIDRK